MGRDFDSNWMSIEAPYDGNRETFQEIVEMNQDQISILLEQVNSLNLEEELRELTGYELSEINKTEVQDKTTESSNDKTASPKNGKETPLNISKMASVFTQWLVKKSSCPVTFTWIDLGIYFWPRWIKTGSCATDVKSDDYDKPTSESKALHF